MKNLKKVAKMAKLSFENAVRLHKDAIYLFKRGSTSTAYQLSILSQEEIGKSFLLEEHVFQMRGREKDIDSELEEMMAKAILSHRVKQGWFSRMADDYFKYKGKRYSKFIREVSSGKLEEKKQNATYVGLTRVINSINVKGKITNPPTRIKIEDAREQITRTNDFIVKLIEGCRRGTTSVDTDELDSILTMKLAKGLERLWKHKSKDTHIELTKLKKFEVDS